MVSPILRTHVPAGSHAAASHIIGPLDAEQFNTIKPLLPDWATKAARDAAYHASQDAYCLIQDEKGQVISLLAGKCEGNLFTTVKFAVCSSEQEYSTDVGAVNPDGTPGRIALHIQDGRIQPQDLEWTLKNSNPRLWPGSDFTHQAYTVAHNVPPPAPPQGDTALQPAILELEPDSPVFKHERQSWNPGSTKRFDQLLYQLLEQNEGVFIGETHDITSVCQSLAYLMPALKSKEVTTLSLEHPQEEIDIYATSGSLTNALNARPNLPAYMVEASYNLVKAAQNCGIKVLGHEMESTGILASASKGAYQHTSEERDGLHQNRLNKLNGYQALRQRDAEAADYISHHKLPGKILVLGGSAHSTNPAMTTENGYEGLNARLGYPSIDFINMRLDCDTQLQPFYYIPGDLQGGTYKNNTGASDYVVSLPRDIKDYMRAHIKPGEYQGTSWPPSKPYAVKIEEVGSLIAPAIPVEGRPTLSGNDAKSR